MEESSGITPRELWEHALEHWDDCVLPDFSWHFGVDTSDEDSFLGKPWWWLRHHILALFGIPDSLTGAHFRVRAKAKN